MSSPTSSSRIRWSLCGLLFFATALSFLDRQVLSVLAPEVSKHLGMSNVTYSHVTNAFLFSYAIMFLAAGRLLDVVGTRKGLAACVALWSIASALHAFVRNALQLGACRFLLGMGEGGCFPGAAKGVAEWFPQRQRALAMGVAIGGASLGAVAAPPLTVWLASAIGWRGVFLVTGITGALWVAAWWVMSRKAASLEGGPPCPPLEDNCSGRQDHPHAAAMTEHRPPSGLESAALPRPTLLALLRRRDVWGLALMRFIFDPVFYFYMFWIPKYLSQERGVSLEQIGKLSWIPFLALGISNITGGWLSDGLIRRGLPPPLARRWIMAAAAVLTMSSSLAAQSKTVGMALAMMSLLMLAHGFWITNYVTLLSERFPKAAVGTVMGLAGAVGASGGMMANTAIGAVVDRFSYSPVWLASGFLYPLAFLVLLATIPNTTREQGTGNRD